MADSPASKRTKFGGRGHGPRATATALAAARGRRRLARSELLLDCWRMFLTFILAKLHFLRHTHSQTLINVFPTCRPVFRYCSSFLRVSGMAATRRPVSQTKDTKDKKVTCVLLRHPARLSKKTMESHGRLPGNENSFVPRMSCYFPNHLPDKLPGCWTDSQD